MLRDYRDWLESELKILGNASHHAYSLGQANMAKRALERLDDGRQRTLIVELDRAEARRVLTAIELLGQRSTAEAPEFAALRNAITAAFDESMPPIDDDREPIDTI